MSSSNMNAAVHTSARVHRCRDDIPGSSATYLTTPRDHDDALDALAAASSAAVSFHGSSRDTFTAHDRGAADPSRPRKHWPGHWPAWVRTLPEPGNDVALVALRPGPG